MLLITNPAIVPSLGKYPGTVGGEGGLQEILVNVITIALILGGVLFFFMLLWGGLGYITAGGDKEATQNAMKRITNATIGLVIIFSSFAIIYLVGQIFGINLLQFNIPTPT